jgi:VanZ family protein
VTLARRRAVFVALALIWAGVIFLASSSANPFPFVPRSFLTQDKLIHAAIYALLGAFIRSALDGTRLPPRTALLLAVSLAAVYGVTDELHQAFVPGRDTSAGDLVADALGACLGAWAASVILRRSGHKASIRA